MSYRIQQVELQSLPPESRSLYKNLIYPDTYDLFNKIDSESHRILTFEASGLNPIGLIAALHYPEINEAFIASFFVTPVFRHQGIGTKLMQSLLEELKRLKTRIIQIQYNSSEELTPFLEKVLVNTHWSNPKTITKRYYLNSHSFHPKWFFSPYPLLPENCTLFAWGDASKEDKKQAEIWVEQSELVALYSPFDSSETIDNKCSLGLHFHGKLAGWLIVHRMSPNLIRYSSLFVIPELRGTGIPVVMLKEAIRRHLNHEIDTPAFIEINEVNSPSGWIRFVEKRLAPSAYKTEIFKTSFIINK